MKDIPRVGFVCTGENALELSGAICCAGRLMRHFSENGYMTGGCFSCIAPSKQTRLLRERMENMCACNDVVIAVGCDGFRQGDVIPDVINALGGRELTYFSCKLSAEEYTDAETGKTHRCFPTRSTALISGGTLIMSVPAELPSSLGKINSLMAAISVAVGNGRGRAPAKSLKLEDLVADFYAGSGFHD